MTVKNEWALGRSRALRLVLAEVNLGLTEDEQTEALERTGIVLDEIAGDAGATEHVIRGLVDLVVNALIDAHEDDDPRAAIVAQLETELLSGDES